MWNRPFLKLALALTILLGSIGAAEEKRIFVLHTNDIHGHIEAYDKGGLTRAASVIKMFREAFPGQVVLLDGGDTSLGTPLSGTYYGMPTAELMSHLKYDAITVGNHEFNWGKTKMRALTDAMEVPVLCANLVSNDGSSAPYPSYTIIERNGVRMAVIGLVTPDTYRRAPAAATKGWNFLPSAQAVRSVIPAIKEDYDILISLNHIGLKADKKLAQAVPELDLIVGGHSHTPLHDLVTARDTPIVQAGCYAQFIGILELSVDTTKDELTVKGYRLHPLSATSPVDPVARDMVEVHARKIRPQLEKVIAEVSGVVEKHPRGDSYDTPLGNFIADVFRAEAQTDIAFYNRGGVRFDMNSGPLTVEDVHKLFPFDDPVMVLQASGRDIRRIVEQGTIDGEGPLSPSGLRAEIVNGKIRSITIHGKPLENNETYTLATTLFLTGGGDGMESFTGLKRIERLPFTRDLLLNYLESHKTIAPPASGRF